MKYMLDTNVLDYFVDKEVKVKISKKVELFVTNVQSSEIENTPNAERRKRLEDALKSLKCTELVVSSPFWDDDLRWNDDAIWRDYPSPEYVTIRGESQANRDTLIVEAALSGGMVLVTSDRRCGKSAKRVGLTVLNASEFFDSI
jgi:rRNA-processing protein FCF1